MSDPVKLAESARLTLAGALKALQSTPDAPDSLMAIAEPIAKSMGILHGIERSGGRDLTGREEALAAVRGALDSLQTIDVNHAAVDEATEAIAGSLSKLFALSRVKPTAEAPAARRPQAPALDPTPGTAPRLDGEAAGPAPATADSGGAGPAAGAQEPPLATTAMAGTPAAVAGSAVEPADPESAKAAAEAAALARQVAEAEAKAAEMRRLAEQKAAEAARRAEEARRRAAEEEAQRAKELKRVPGQTDAPAPPESGLRIEVELGAHSPSNFYKGLSGNDVVDHGGIFVATYRIPKIGTPVALRVLLPGDLEFDADAVVHWVRETQSGESKPGFGARLTRISGEGRQLVYRYARNREPMFHDDL